jgi:hypothetical protein
MRGAKQHGKTTSCATGSNKVPELDSNLIIDLTGQGEKSKFGWGCMLNAQKLHWQRGVMYPEQLFITAENYSCFDLTLQKYRWDLGHPKG